MATGVVKVNIRPNKALILPANLTSAILP